MFQSSKRKGGEQYGCVWIGVIDTVDKKHGTKDLISLKGKHNLLLGNRETCCLYSHVSSKGVFTG